MNPSNELLDMIRETQARVDALDAKCAALEARINPGFRATPVLPEFISSSQACGVLDVSYPTFKKYGIKRYPMGQSVKYRSSEVISYRESLRES